MLANERRVLLLRASCGLCLLVAASLLLSSLASSSFGQAAPTRSLPTEIVVQPSPPPEYFAGLALYRAGDYSDAAVTFQSVISPPGALSGNPVEQICVLTMQGECYYQTGQYAKALANYEAAIRIQLVHRWWPAEIVPHQPLPPLVAPPPPWFQSQRKTMAWNLAPTGSLRGYLSGQAITSARGTGRAPPLSINVQEVARCTGLALYRWLELLGPLCSHDPLIPKIVQRGTVRSVPIKPWSTAVGGVQSGLFAAVQQKTAVAEQALQSALTVNGFDHPLTGMALLVLGRLSANRGDPVKAEAYFLEASVAAARFGDLTVVEEALSAAATIHLARGDRSTYAPLHSALAWASASGSVQLPATLLMLAAEDDWQAGQPQSAAAKLAACSQLIGTTSLASGRAGARLNYLKALVACGIGDVADGRAALEASLAFQRQGSLWQFRTEMVDLFWKNHLLNERQAAQLFDRVLSDPTANDWEVDPLESLSSLVIPHPAPFEHWFEAALARKEPKLALEVVEQLRRHRFLNTLHLGGRLLGLRWALEARPELLDKQTAAQRQRILARWPRYADLSQRARVLQAELKTKPLTPEKRDEQNSQQDKLTELKRLSAEQELILRQIALERQACNLAFPPLKKTSEIQTGLADRQGILVFFEDSAHFHAFLVTSAQVEHWQIKTPAKQVGGRVKALLQQWGNVDSNKQIRRGDLAAERWQPTASQLFKIFVADSKVDFTQNIDELAIIPDGMLWYLPFETLQISDGNGARSLISRQRVRYAPTAGLAVGDVHPHRPRNTAVALGRLFPREDEQLARTRFDELLRINPQAVALNGKLPADSALFGSILEQLVVYDEISATRNGPLAWSPLPTVAKSADASLADWLILPWGGPDQVLLPGFHTSAESAIRGIDDQTAVNEIFVPLCGLMATGARTVLINRWRTGGQTTQELLREFVQELPESYASDAWQRSVQLVTTMHLRVEEEPRLKRDGKYDGLLADHPFFWAGFMLADTGSPPPETSEKKGK